MQALSRALSKAEQAAAYGAMRGVKLALRLDHPVCRAATIRGIRDHIGYAKSPEITALCTGKKGHENPDFARARNARLIMSNIIPKPEELAIEGELSSADPDKTRVPYCIWHPEFAMEETYRSLVAAYPSMRYQVGRACAAAGMDKLYAELDLLPDVTIAEEARESKTQGGSIIYDKIMSAPCRYAIMNDYERSINMSDPAGPAFLNGDTNVLRTLEYRPVSGLSIQEQDGVDLYNDNPMPCIIETGYILLNSGEGGPYPTLSNDELKLLYTPLPLDLPTVNKTLLIQMAAYNGDVDRYSRLVRRALYMSNAEHLCVLRGILHSPMFARFWALQLADDSRLARRMCGCHYKETQRAISARRIMSNDCSEFENGWDTSKPMPMLLWWPQKPAPMTLCDLYEAAPPMREAAVVACIMCDYEDFFEKLAHSPPTDTIYLAARTSSNPVYMARVLEQAEQAGVDVVSKYRREGIPDVFDPASCIVEDLEPSEEGYVSGGRPDGIRVTGGDQSYCDREVLNLDCLHKLIWHLPLEPGEERF
ncbi:hypothetical protein IF1G_00670 [Cordyceps javanica]|uniref:Uncharacterized protein n=1 Tax=Cordyceps javanica TaxID=43265 RepID=A0A545VG88_9HYPO|nr:hypothetical protein IF1G_00670 [Cordyceps javanica]TQW11918.1 hypothetical protein IF2G_00649 [Cordyceps javanica]